LDALDEALHRIVGARVAVRVRRAMTADPSRPFAGAVAVSLARADDVAAERRLILEAEPALVANVTARAIGRPPPRVVGTGRLGDDVLGAFAAIVAAVGRRAGGERGVRVVGVGDVDAPPPGAVTLSLLIQVDDDAYSARVVSPAFSVPEAPWNLEALVRMGPTPLSLPVVACAWSMTAGDLASTRRGDVLLGGPAPDFRPVNGEWTGTGWLAPPASDTGVRIELVDGRSIVLRGGPELLSRPAMPDPDAGEALVTAIGEVPVVVRVEIGEATLPAREWASLSKGDVLTLGRRIGDRVLLRVGGVPVARGELVDVDGEVGVRIAERLGEPGDRRKP
jgi:type III secretion system YscQ/HrcQ family protein